MLEICLACQPYQDTPPLTICTATGIKPFLLTWVFLLFCACLFGLPSSRNKTSLVPTLEGMVKSQWYSENQSAETQNQTSLQRHKASPSRHRCSTACTLHRTCPGLPSCLTAQLGPEQSLWEMPNQNKAHPHLHIFLWQSTVPSPLNPTVRTLLPPACWCRSRGSLQWGTTPGWCCELLHCPQLCLQLCPGIPLMRWQIHSPAEPLEVAISAWAVPQLSGQLVSIAAGQGSAMAEAMHTDLMVYRHSKAHQPFPAACDPWFQDVSMHQMLPGPKVLRFSFKNW